MPANFDLPRKDKKLLGEVLYDAIVDASHRDLSPVSAKARAVHSYLNGDRYFRVMDPFDESRTILEINNPIDQPSWEAITSDVSQELGIQLLHDVSPSTYLEELTLNGQRDAAISYAMLRYLFPKRVYEQPHHSFQKYRVEDGCAGLIVEPTETPVRGWGLKITAIPQHQLVFLPSRARARGETNSISYVKFLPMDEITRRIALLNIDLPEDERIKVPKPDSKEAARFLTVDADAGHSVDEVAISDVLALIGGAGGTKAKRHGRGEGFGDDGKHDRAKKTHRIQMGLFIQTFITPDHTHVERHIIQIGKHILRDREFLPHEQPQMPIATSVFSDVGGPYGVSFAWPKMMAHLYMERLLTSLSRSAQKIDAFGIVAASTGMGISASDIQEASEHGLRLMTYRTDPLRPQAQPQQFLPTPLNQVFGGLPAFFSKLPDAIFPRSGVLTGESEGRVDSDRAITQLRKQAEQATKAGSASVKFSWSQMYRSGLEQARTHYEGHSVSIPLTFLDPDMAGVVLDTIDQPQAQTDIDRTSEARTMLASQLEGVGQDPDIALTQIPGPPQIPVGRFRVDRNIIPHPDTVGITIGSDMPRDDETEFEALRQRMADGLIGPAEFQIEVYKRGINKFVGGRSNWGTYQSTLLNILSVFGDGITPGPQIIPLRGGIPMISYTLIGMFMSQIPYALSSPTVQAAIMNLQEAYAPINAPTGALDPASSAQLEDQRQQLARRQQGPASAGARPRPQLAQRPSG